MEPLTAKFAPLHKGAIECAPCIPKQSASPYKSINDSAPCTPKRQERVLSRRRGPGAHKGIRLDQPWHRPENIKILLLAWGAKQQDFEGLVWGQRIRRPRPISYQAHGPCRGGRNVWGRAKKVQTALSSADWDHGGGKCHAAKGKSPRASQRKSQAQWASHRGMVEKQFQERLSPPH